AGAQPRPAALDGARPRGGRAVAADRAADGSAPRRAAAVAGHHGRGRRSGEGVAPALGQRGAGDVVPLGGHGDHALVLGDALPPRGPAAEDPSNNISSTIATITPSTRAQAAPSATAMSVLRRWELCGVVNPVPVPVLVGCVAKGEVRCGGVPGGGLPGPAPAEKGMACGGPLCTGCCAGPPGAGPPGGVPCCAH